MRSVGHGGLVARWAQAWVRSFHTPPDMPLYGMWATTYRFATSNRTGGDFPNPVLRLDYRISTYVDVLISQRVFSSRKTRLFTRGRLCPSRQPASALAIARQRNLEDFQFKGAPIIQSLVNDLAGGGFIAQQRNVVLVGGTGTRKTHMAIAIARSCIRSGARGRFDNVLRCPPRCSIA